LIDAGKFFVPGPTEVRPEVLDAMRRPVIFHRNAEMEALMRRVTAGLSAVFGTKRPAHVITGSGTSAMEMSIRNGATKRVLSIVHGDFGERFAKLAEACGRSVTRLQSEPGDVVPLDKIRDALRSGYDTVLATHSETALGVLADIKGIGALVREQSDCLLFVDAVSSAGATPIEMDAWGVDAVVTASQKSLALPPGLAFAAVSDRFLTRAKSMADRGAYLDILKYEEFTAKAQSPTTPAVSLLYALDRQMQDVAKETLAGRYARHLSMAQACVAWVERVAASGVDIAVMARKGLGSPSVTCIRTPWKTSDVLARARAEGFELGGGQAQFTNSTFRVGHMGDHTLGGMNAMLVVLEKVLRAL
jgi:aspartate aminotransferase-like enzyme